jgi:hypothetical protein
MGNLIMWQWYEWETRADFDTWHNAKKLELGLPRLSIDKHSNPCEPVIENYTQAVQKEGKVIAMVEDDHANDLILTDLRPSRFQDDIIS